MEGIDITTLNGEGLPYLGNYIGPHWSDGKYQESVEWGDSDPQDELDLLAYYHDSSYARFKDKYHRAAADKAFYEQASAIPGALAKLAGNSVLYGNYTKDRLSNMLSSVKTGTTLGGPLGGVLGLVYSGVKGIVDLNDRLPGGAYEKAEKAVKAYQLTDPKKRQNMFAPKAEKAEPEGWKQTVSHDPVAPVIKKDKSADYEKRWKAVSSKPAATTTPKTDQANKPPMMQAQEVVVNDPRSLFTRLFKRKNKKPAKQKKKTPEEIIALQAQHFQKHKELQENAINSKLLTSSQLKFKPFGFNGRYKRAYSMKRRTQN